MNVGIPFYTVPLDGSSAGALSTNESTTSEETKQGSDVINSDKYDLRLEKSNILMLGPTGSGKEQAESSSRDNALTFSHALDR